MGSNESSCPPNAVPSTSTEGTHLKNAKESNFLEDVKKAMENQDLKSVASITQVYLEDINNIQLNIAITGESGSGKSTFVNAFRGIDNKDERAARTGVVETTMMPIPYPHPIYPNVTLWDLPGIGTTNYPADHYLKHVGFEKFDFFIIVSADRFRENDAKLAQEIKKMAKKFYFVRSKIDNNLRDAQRSQEEYDEEKTLQEIRNNCIQGLEKKDMVFLVSSFDLKLYDFPALQETMERELPSHKRDVLILALPNISKIIINRKKEVFRKRMKYHAFVSAAGAAVPIPGLSIAADLDIMVRVLHTFSIGFGLDKRSLQQLSRATEKPLKDLRAVVKSPCSLSDVTQPLLCTMMRTVSVDLTFEVAEEVTRFIPYIGMPKVPSNSFSSIYNCLNSTLDSLSVDAENVLLRALDMK